MKRLLPIRMKYLLPLLLLFLGASSLAQTPTIVNTFRQVSTYLPGTNTASVTGCNMGVASETDYDFCYGDLTLANNVGIVALTISSAAPTITITDDGSGGSNTYTQVISNTHGGGQNTYFYTAPLAHQAHQVHVHFSVATTGIQANAMQVMNTSGVLDGTPVGANSAGSATVATANITSTQANSIYFQLAVEDGGQRPVWTQGAGFTLEDVSLRESWAVQWQVYATAASHPCSITINPSSSWSTVCFALKAATQGTAPPAMYVRSGFLAPMEDSVATYTFQTPCTGNLLVAASNMNTGAPVTSMSSTNPTKTWTEIGSGVTNTEGEQEIFFAVATWTNSSQTVLTTNSNSSLSEVAFYCIVGASATQPDSSLATGSGTQSTFNTGPPSTVSATVTPGRNGGIMIGTVGVALNGTTSCSPTGYQDNQSDNNNWCHWSYSSTAAQAFNVTMDERNGASGAGAWSGAYAAFAANGASGGSTNQFPRIL